MSSNIITIGGFIAGFVVGYLIMRWLKKKITIWWENRAKRREDKKMKKEGLVYRY